MKSGNYKITNQKILSLRDLIFFFLVLPFLFSLSFFMFNKYKLISTFSL
jgi:hypothetical protein